MPSPVVQREEDSALVCCVRGFYPQDIAVSWLRDGQELNASFVSAARRGHRDETFSLVSVYSFTPTEQDLGALFSCRARHPALNQSRQADFRITFRGEASARLRRPGREDPHDLSPSPGAPGLSFGLTNPPALGLLALTTERGSPWLKRPAPPSTGVNSMLQPEPPCIISPRYSWISPALSFPPRPHQERPTSEPPFPPPMPMCRVRVTDPRDFPLPDPVGVSVLPCK